MKQTFLEYLGEPPVLLQVWYQMFQDHLLASGHDNLLEQQLLAILRSSLGREAFRICTELVEEEVASYGDTVRSLSRRFAPKVTFICSRAMFNRRIQ